LSGDLSGTGNPIISSSQRGAMDVGNHGVSARNTVLELSGIGTRTSNIASVSWVRTNSPVPAEEVVSSAVPQSVRTARDLRCAATP